MKKSNLLIKLIAAILVFSFALFAFASCDSQETPNNDVNNDPTNSDSDSGNGDVADSDNDDAQDSDSSDDSTDPVEVVYTLEGSEGKSGYQIAVDSGFKGTINEWLDHFIGTADAEKAEELRELLTTKHQLRVNEDGSFKVLVLSDVQASSRVINKETISNIKTICEREQPDLVIFNGDNSFDIRNAAAMKTYVKLMSEWCEDNKVPWAHVYGNHDDETPIGEICVPKEEQQEIYESFEYCVSKAGDPDIAGVGNFVLPVYTYDGTAIAFNVWALDSGSYDHAYTDADLYPVGGNNFFGHYAGMQGNQVNWYYNASKTFEEFHGGKVLGMMTFHIPLQEVWTAWSQKEALGLEWDGEKRENISACSVNCGLFDKILARKDVKLVVNSHDHINDFSIKYKGVRFAYTACIGTEEYHADDMLGGRVINFSASDPEDFETYMSYVNERLPVDNTTPILKLKIEDDGTVSNDIESGMPLNTNDYAGLEKTVSKDSEINKNVITFVGNTDKPSTYNIPATTFMSTLADGFSYEVMFKITDNTFSSNYVGVLDFEESGGFGLDIYKSSDSSKAIIHAEVAYGTGWNSLEYTIELNKWYHVVYSYDGTNAVLYINGEEVAKASLNAAFRAPNFVSRTGEEFICIGACAQAWGTNGKKSTGINGMTGSIAIANIFATPLTASQATALYNAVK